MFQLWMKWALQRKSLYALHYGPPNHALQLLLPHRSEETEIEASLLGGTMGINMFKQSNHGDNYDSK